MKPTQNQVFTEISSLKKLMTLAPTDVSGGLSTQEQIEDQILVLIFDLEEKDLPQTGLTPADHQLAAIRWRLGESDIAPSAHWESLIKK